MWKKSLQTPVSALGLGVAGSMLLGVSFVQLFASLPHIFISLLLLPFGVYIWWRYSTVIRCIGVLLFAIAWACLHGAYGMSQRIHVAQEVEVTGYIANLPIKDEHATFFELQIQESSDNFLIGKRVRLSAYGQHPELKAGTQWRLQVQLKPPRGVLNPGAYDFERRALERNIAAIGHVKKIDAARMLKPASGIDAWREQRSGLISKLLASPDARFIQALALGDTRQLSDEDWLLLRMHGLTHLIAISGFHVGMVAGFAVLLIRLIYSCLPWFARSSPRPQIAAIAAVLAAFAYTAIAGFALPTWRTFLMIAVIAIARVYRRNAGLGQSINLALFAILLCDPLAVLLPGFWLSFAGVCWLACCLPSQSTFSIWQFRENVYLFLHSQWVALIGLAPLSIWFFGQTSLLAPFTNLIAIPVISFLVVPLALLGLFLSFFNHSGATFFWQSGADVMAVFWQCLQSIGNKKWLLVSLPEPSLFSLCLAAIAAWVLLQPKKVPGKALALCLFLPLLAPELNTPKQDEVDISLIDVGQGLSVLIQTQEHAMLYDTGAGMPGRFDRGESIVIPSLQAKGVRHLDRIVVSHGDNDHAGGLASTRAYYPDAEIIAPEGWRDNSMKACFKTQRWQWDGVQFEFLHPPHDFPYQRNESSCVLRIQASSKVILLTGDIGQWIEKRLIREQAQKIQADVLLVPHHGSGSSSSDEFIAAVSPNLALIASGADNRFQHPRPQVLARYHSRGIETAGSVEQGWLSIRLNEHGVHWLERRRQSHSRYWHHPN